MLSPYKNELPSQSSLNAMTIEAAEAIADLLEIAAYIDESLSAEEIEVLREEMSMLSIVNMPEILAFSGERGFFKRDSVGKHYTEEEIEATLEASKKRINHDLDKQSCVRLLAVLCCSDGLDAVEIDFFRRVVEKLDYDTGTSEEILRAAYEARQKVGTHEPRLF